MAWSRSRRRNPPRASWSLAPLRAAAHRGRAWGVLGLAATVWGGGGVLDRWAVEGGAAEGPGPAQQGWGLPSPPRSRGQPWLHGLPAPGLCGPPHSSGRRWPGTPAHGGAGRGSQEAASEALGSVCAPVCACSLQHWQAACDVSWCRGWGGALKGHQSPQTAAMPKWGRRDRQGSTHPHEDMPPPSTHPETKTHTQTLPTLTDIRTLRHTFHANTARHWAH